MGRQLHSSGRQGNAVRTRSLIRQYVEKNCNCSDVRATSSERNPYYGSYVQQRCNRLDTRATPSECNLDMEKPGTCYEKLVAQKTVRTLYDSVQMPPREYKDRLDLGLLSL